MYGEKVYVRAAVNENQKDNKSSLNAKEPKQSVH